MLPVGGEDNILMKRAKKFIIPIGRIEMVVKDRGQGQSQGRQLFVSLYLVNVLCGGIQ